MVGATFCIFRPFPDTSTVALGLQFKIDKAMIASRTIIPKVLVLLVMFLASVEVKALPSFARQTGMPCTTCHLQAFGPNLTPFGRNFKLTGYTMSSGNNTKLIPLAAMVQGSFTHTQRGQPDGAADHFGSNNNAAMDEASIFYAGRVTSKVGAFMQTTFDGVERKNLILDNTDIRFADQASLGSQQFVYGISANNSPTVSDLWNTTPAWSLPATSSALAPTPAAGTLIESLAGQVGGVTAYMMWNNLLYVESGGYASLPRNVQQTVNTFDPEQNKIDGGAPYWRVALQHNHQGHYGAIGSFGMRANVNPQRMQGARTDQYTDFGFDATYQYLANLRHIFELTATYVRENRDMNASMALGLAEKKHSSLDTVRIRAAYTYQQTYSLSLHYGQTSGTADSVIYFSTDPISGSRSGKPNNQAFTAELSYVPFGKTTSTLSTLANVRLAAQYVHYFQFNGGIRNYDGSGRSAAGNDTLFLSGWLAF